MRGIIASKQVRQSVSGGYQCPGNSWLDPRKHHYIGIPTLFPHLMFNEVAHHVIRFAVSLSARARRRASPH